MFVIGFLSSPIPLVLLAFFYLLMFSYGHFAKKDFNTSEDNNQSISLTYEPNNLQIKKHNESFNYFAFVKQLNKHSKKDQHKSTIGKIDYPPLLQQFIIPSNSTSYFYHWHSALTNRPPPLV